MERTCKTCLDIIAQNKTYSTVINMLKRKPANEYYQMLPYDEGEYKPRQKNFDFESATEISMIEDSKRIVKRRFERIFKMMEYKSYIKNEVFPENKQIFFLFKDSNILKQIKPIIID